MTPERAAELALYYMNIAACVGAWLAGLVGVIALARRL